MLFVASKYLGNIHPLRKIWVIVKKKKRKENVSLALPLGAKIAVFTSAKNSTDLMGVLINTFA